MNILEQHPYFLLILGFLGGFVLGCLFMTAAAERLVNTIMSHLDVFEGEDEDASEQQKHRDCVFLYVNTLGPLCGREGYMAIKAEKAVSWKLMKMA